MGKPPPPELITAHDGGGDTTPESQTIHGTTFGIESAAADRVCASNRTQPPTEHDSRMQMIAAAAIPITPEQRVKSGAVKRVLGGTWQPNDDGSEPSQVDVLLDLEDRRRVALEVTSEGEYDVHKARSAINKRADRGEFAGKTLSYMWYVCISVDRWISDLSLTELEETLREFEAQGLQIVSSRGAHPPLR